jgi:WD40 repeat protein
VSRGTWSNRVQEVISGLASLEALAVGRSRVAVGGRNGTVYVLTDRAELSVAVPGPGDPVLSVALLPDDSAVIAGTQDGSVLVIRLNGGNGLVIPDAHPGGVTAVAVSRDGSYLATGGKDRAVRVWRPAGGGFELAFAVTNLPSRVRSLEFGRSDNRLLVLPMNEHVARVWDLDVLHRQFGALNLGW